MNTHINVHLVRLRDADLAAAVEREAKGWTPKGYAIVSRATWRRLRGLPEPLPNDPASVERIKQQQRHAGCCGPPTGTRP